MKKGNNQILAMEDNDNNKFYYHPDHLGSTTLVTNQTGDVVDYIVCLPYEEIYKRTKISSLAGIHENN
jgi:hypothetical protein